MAITDELMRQLQGGGISEISRQLGIDEGKVAEVAAGAIPTLVTGLAAKSGSTGGAASLAAALDRDHDGSVLDDMMGFLGGGQAASQGAGILGHVLGSKQQTVSRAFGQQAGLDATSVQQILAMLAPLVLGYLGKAKRQQGLDGSGLASMLGAERRSAATAAPDAMGMLGKLLDADGDGSMLDEVAELGGGLLGGLLGKR